MAPKVEKVRLRGRNPDGKEVRQYHYAGLRLNDEAAEAVKAHRRRWR